LDIVKSVEISESLSNFVKGLHMLQGQCNEFCATRDDASVDVADGINKVNVLIK